MARLLARHNGAEVAILRPDATVLVATDPDSPQVFVDRAETARRTGVIPRSCRRRRPEAEVTFPLAIHGERVIVAARKPIAACRRRPASFAARSPSPRSPGLVGALLVGSLLAGRLVRASAACATRRCACRSSGPEAELSPDRGRDEIGDLSRAFATMQQRLREQEQARRAFVATASHELRTPLTSLQVMLDLLNEDLRLDPPDVESARAQSASAEAQVQRLASLAADLLDLSRIDAGIPLRTELVEVGAIVRSVTAELEVRAGTHIDLDGRRSTRSGPSAIPAASPRSCASSLDNALRARRARRARSASMPSSATAWLASSSRTTGRACPPTTATASSSASSAAPTPTRAGSAWAWRSGASSRAGWTATSRSRAMPPGARFVLSLAGAPSP